MKDIRPFVVAPEQPLRTVLLCIDRNARGVAMVLEEDGRLVGLLTDGDVRRALLSGLTLDSSAREVIEAKPGPPALVASLGTSPRKLVSFMRGAGVEQLPLVDDRNVVVALTFLSDLTREAELPVRAVIMSGGYGRRLRPLTDEVPKPLLPVGGRPLLELIVERLRKAGIRKVFLTTHYKGEQIVQHFGDGSAWDVELTCIQEPTPLGTAGALRLLPPGTLPLLVMNGDLLTDAGFAEMLDFHREENADLTIGVRSHEVSVPFGVVETEAERVKEIVEKPTYRCSISAGIYLVEPKLCKTIEAGQTLDMPHWINRLVQKGARVVAFPITGYWRDIGRRSDLRRADEDVRRGVV